MSAIHAAIAQLSPTVLDGPAAVDKTCQFIARAGEEGIQLLAFPETFIPGYPFWADRRASSWWSALTSATRAAARCGTRS